MRRKSESLPPKSGLFLSAWDIWQAAAIFFPSHDKNVSSGGILSARRCLRTRIFFLYGLIIIYLCKSPWCKIPMSQLMLTKHIFMELSSYIYTEWITIRQPFDVFIIYDFFLCTNMASHQIPILWYAKY